MTTCRKLTKENLGIVGFSDVAGIIAGQPPERVRDGFVRDGSGFP
jgi:hypothetical protein